MLLEDGGCSPADLGHGARSSLVGALDDRGFEGYVAFQVLFLAMIRGIRRVFAGRTRVTSCLVPA